ncbi:PIN domain-like protein [Moniliophthora roreri]|nr:PIN domain-like protein [Moniliophthora roreri]
MFDKPKPSEALPCLRVSSPARPATSLVCRGLIDAKGGTSLLCKERHTQLQADWEVPRRCGL